MAARSILATIIAIFAAYIVFQVIGWAYGMVVAVRELIFGALAVGGIAPPQSIVESWQVVDSAYTMIWAYLPLVIMIAVILVLLVNSMSRRPDEDAPPPV